MSTQTTVTAAKRLRYACGLSGGRSSESEAIDETGRSSITVSSSVKSRVLVIDAFSSRWTAFGFCMDSAVSVDSLGVSVLGKGSALAEADDIKVKKARCLF